MEEDTWINGYKDVEKNIIQKKGDHNMPKKSSKQSRAKTKKVGFQLFAPEAQKVTLAGDFNDWDVNTIQMKKDSKGTWKASVSLPSGRYEYRFWVDAVWHDDPNAEGRVENPFGSQNCVKLVR